MQRFDFVGGLFVRLGRRWIGLVSAFPFVAIVPVIAGGTEAVSTQNVFLSFLDDGSPASPTGEIAEVKAIPMGETSEELDATHLRSPGNYREYLQSYKDGNDIPMVLNFIPGDTSQQTLRTRWESGLVAGYRETFPDGTYVEFLAYVSAMGVPVTVGAVLELNCSLRITGPTTWTFAA